MNQPFDDYQEPPSWAERLADVPLDELVDFLRSKSFLVVVPGLWTDPDEVKDDAVSIAPIYLISQTKYYMDYVEPGDLKIRLSGSIRDQDLEEVIREGWDKHNWRLADKIADIL